MAAFLSHEDGPAHEARIFVQGIHLFNDRQWFEAHEVWEDIWRESEGTTKLFYQGLIQCAVVLVHLQRGNPRGALAVFETARRKFRQLPPSFGGLDLRAFEQAMSQLLAPVAALPEHRRRPGAPHGQDLPVDWAMVPKLYPSKSSRGPTA
jgi:hypothetical protein